MNSKLLISIPFIFLFFSPPLAYFISLVFLIILSQYKVVDKKKYFILLGSITLVSLFLIISSYELFLYKEDDFTNYYNNYLDFLNKGLVFSNFEYGFGFEIGVPLLNYILSLLISENVPYIVYALHSTILLGLLTYIVYLISKYYLLDLNKSILLFVFIIVLYKYGMAMNQLRQAYASLFILIALFNPKHRYIYIIIAILFHLSSLIIYPLISFLLLSTSIRKLKLFSIFSILVALGLYSFINLNFDIIISTENILLNKIKLFILLAQQSESFIEMLPLSEVLYLLLLIILHRFIIIYYKIDNKSYWNLYSIFIFTIVFSFLYGISLRILSAIFTFLLGFLFFRYLLIEIKVKQAYLFVLIFIILFQIKFTFYNQLYFKNYPLASSVPLYYIPHFFNTSDYIDREGLPSRKDLNIKKRIEEIL